MRYLNRNRITRGSGIATGGTNDPTGLATYSAIITLTQSFEILEVLDLNTVRIDTSLLDLFATNQTVRIDGSTPPGDVATNDGLYFVDSAILGSDPTTTDVRFFFGNLVEDLPENGRLHLVTDVRVTHNLDTEDIIYRVKNVETGATVSLTDDSTDRNVLVLRTPFPETPEVGDFRISIVGFNR